MTYDYSFIYDTNGFSSALTINNKLQTNLKSFETFGWFKLLILINKSLNFPN